MTVVERKENNSESSADTGDTSKEAEILEAALGTLLELATGHEENSRRVLSAGVATLIDIAERGVAEKGGNATDPTERGTKQDSEKKVAVAWEESKERRKTPPPGKERTHHAITISNSSLAVDLLQTIGPYSYTLCSNCGSRENGGQRCKVCGHKIKFSV